MNRIIYRDMTSEDVAQAVDIENQNFSRPWKKEDFLDSLLLADTLFIVAQDEESEEIQGYCGCYQSFEEGNITNVAVKDSVRRQGIAFGMLNAVLEKGRKRGISRFFLEVRVSNLPAIMLYEKLGFQTAGIRKDFYVEPVENAWVMVLDQEQK